MQIDILTLFPVMFLGPLQESILKRAQERDLLTIFIHQIRDYATDRHQLTDDVPYGGGEGMIMRPAPVFRAVESIPGSKEASVILLTPQGRTFTQAIAQDLAQRAHLIFICGHYGGFDERLRTQLAAEELSIGDYVLTGGELAAMVVIDALARWIPGVLGALESAQQDSYAQGLLEGPQYTHPACFHGEEVPEVLRSGDHARIARWRREQALQRTWLRRPELLDQAPLTDEDRACLARLSQMQQEEENKKL